MLSTRIISVFLLLAGCISATAQAKSGAVLTPAEARVTRAFDRARDMGPGELYALLEAMPKGADLHMHLSGAVYAETLIAEGIREGLCVDPFELKFTPRAANVTSENPCLAHDDVPAVDILKSYEVVANGLTGQALYDKLVDSFSMRSFVPISGFDGHDQFFSTFDRFSGVKGDTSEWLDEVARRAARQNEQYLEIMTTPPFEGAVALSSKLAWPSDIDDASYMQIFARLRDALLAAGLRGGVAVDSEQISAAMAGQRQMEHCDSATPAAACGVKIHFLYQILRAFPPQQVFAQTLLGFETIRAESKAGHPNFVGINFVQPEDDRVAMKDYHLQMLMLDFLHSIYPDVRISLHAGELAPGLVPPRGLTFHIRQAIDLGHASRIGHGVDVLYENNAAALLKEMAAKHIMVEINLTSNEGILGIEGKAHPLAAYRAANVPVALSTDDEGVSRIDLTHEYVKGAEEQSLNYVDLKKMARTSLEHAFLQGESLWLGNDEFTRRKSVCAAPITANSTPAASCDAFLKGSERASEQWQLERRFALYEASVH
ncbi:MAG: adenosine deaminase [Acidobacteria bacterium]|nr:adenosine deaminase [Acidobacteriota bacterium]